MNQTWIIAASFALATSANAQQAKLYSGEQSVTAAGYPAVAYFKKGDAGKPLVVFVPGAHHMARIAYGGHAGANAKDFLAHWLGAKGYSFLALSYPMDVAQPTFETKHPDYTAQIWGKQVAEIAQKTVAANNLGNKIVIAAWSMGGKVVQPSAKAANEAGLSVITTVSFAATPAMPGLISYTARFKMAPSGYADRSNLYAGWLKQLERNTADNGGRVAIPEAIFRNEYVGDMSVNLQGYGEVYRNGKFELDHKAQMDDYGAFDFGSYPLVTVLENNEVADARHGIADRANWNLYNTNMIIARYIAASGVKLDALPADQWTKLLALSHELDKRLTFPVDGNHFFFVGEKGARQAAEVVETAIQHAEGVKAELSALLGKPVQ